MKQAAYLFPKAPFAFKPGGTGRAVQVKAEQVFWVTNSELNQSSTGRILIARKGSGTCGQGWAFSPEQIAQLFTVEA